MPGDQLQVLNRAIFPNDRSKPDGSLDTSLLGERRIDRGDLAHQVRGLYVPADADALRSRVIELLHDDKVEAAISLCSRSRGPVPAILAVGLHR